MSDVNDADEVDPIVFHFGAGKFLLAADELFGSHRPPVAPSQAPIYLLYVHSLELALKAYLRHVGMSTAVLGRRPYGHDVGRLYDEAVARGLEPLPEHAQHFDAVLSLTTESNRDQSLRYWIPERTQAPKIEWLRSVAHALLSHINTRMRADRASAPPTKPARRETEVFGPEHFGLPELPAPPLRVDGKPR